MGETWGFFSENVLEHGYLNNKHGIKGGEERLWGHNGNTRRVYGCAMILDVFWTWRINIQCVAVQWYKLTNTYQANCAKNCSKKNVDILQSTKYCKQIVFDLVWLVEVVGTPRCFFIIPFFCRVNNPLGSRLRSLRKFNPYTKVCLDGPWRNGSHAFSLGPGYFTELLLDDHTIWRFPEIIHWSMDFPFF